jgi:hypothetical protein
MKKLSAIFLSVLLAIATCTPQKTSANILLDTAKSASTIAGFGLGSITLFAGILSYRYSYDNPSQGKRATCMRLTILGLAAAGLAASGCLIAMGDREMAEKILGDIITKR